MKIHKPKSDFEKKPTTVELGSCCSACCTAEVFLIGGIVLFAAVGAGLGVLVKRHFKNQSAIQDPSSGVKKDASSGALVGAIWGIIAFVELLVLPNSTPTIQLINGIVLFAVVGAFIGVQAKRSRKEQSTTQDSLDGVKEYKSTGALSGAMWGTAAFFVLFFLLNLSGVARTIIHGLIAGGLGGGLIGGLVAGLSKLQRIVAGISIRQGIIYGGIMGAVLALLTGK